MKTKSSPIKQMTCLVLVVSLLLSCSMSSALTDENKPNETPEFLYNQDLANTSYNDLLRAFAKEGGVDELQVYYPDFYSGSYIGDDGHLVVIVNNANESDYSYIEQVCDNKNISFESAQYSFNQLISLKNAIRDTVITGSANTAYNENKMEESFVITYGVRDDLNKVRIGLTKFDDESIADFCELLNENPKLVLEQLDAFGIAYEDKLGKISAEMLADLPLQFYQDEQHYEKATLKPGDYITS